MKVTYQPTRLTVTGNAREITRYLSRLCQEDGGQTPLQVALAKRLSDPRLHSFTITDGKRTAPR